MAETTTKSSLDRDRRRTKLVEEIRAERERQIQVEGWTPEHDAEHANGELARAASCYARAAGTYALRDAKDPYLASFLGHDRDGWPWAREWWKPTGQRRCLVKAAALILAELERIDSEGGA